MWAGGRFRPTRAATAASFDETVRRHAGRPALAHITPEMMRGWYRPLDLLGVPGEQVIPESSPLAATVATILHVSGLARAAALTPCPLTCPRCAEKRGRNTLALDEVGGPPAPAGWEGDGAGGNHAP